MGQGRGGSALGRALTCASGKCQGRLQACALTAPQVSAAAAFELLGCVCMCVCVSFQSSNKINRAKNPEAPEIAHWEESLTPRAHDAGLFGRRNSCCLRGAAPCTLLLPANAPSQGLPARCGAEAQSGASQRRRGCAGSLGRPGTSLQDNWREGTPTTPLPGPDPAGVPLCPAESRACASRFPRTNPPLGFPRSRTIALLSRAINFHKADPGVGRYLRGSPRGPDGFPHKRVFHNHSVLGCGAGTPTPRWALGPPPPKTQQRQESRGRGNRRRCSEEAACMAGSLFPPSFGFRPKPREGWRKINNYILQAFLKVMTHQEKWPGEGEGGGGRASAGWKWRRFLITSN